MGRASLGVRGSQVQILSSRQQTRGAKRFRVILARAISHGFLTERPRKPIRERSGRRCGPRRASMPIPTSSQIVCETIIKRRQGDEPDS
jgi:hypothetical protein